MSKNIEININTNGSAYEPLYPKTLASNIAAGTFTGSFTFESVPSCSVNPSGTNHLVRKGWIDSQGYATQSWVNGQLGNAGSVKIKTGMVEGTGSVPSTGQVIHRVYVGFLPKLFFFGRDGTVNGGVIDFDKGGTNANARFTSTRDIIIMGADLTRQVTVSNKQYDNTLRWGYSYVNLGVIYKNKNIEISLTGTLGGATPTDGDGFLNGQYDEYGWLAIGE